MKDLNTKNGAGPAGPTPEAISDLISQVDFWVRFLWTISEAISEVISTGDFCKRFLR